MEIPETRSIQVGRIRACYFIGGSEGSLIVLVHGLGGYKEHWLPSFWALAAEHRVMAVDLPGHGETDKPADAPYSIEYLTQFVGAFVSALDLPRAHVVGHSLGGAIALRLTLLHPELVDRLALLSSAGLGPLGPPALPPRQPAPVGRETHAAQPRGIGQLCPPNRA